MKHLQEPSLQRLKETVHQLRIIEMEGVLTVVTLEEIPVHQGDGLRRHTPMKFRQLR